ncbi:conserved protein of unknown function [Flavobacterium collinsii]|uniref:Transmembrane protein n=2 Tax=Flavobacterium collinsii TaxID=1114861 RepID=A0A9W4TKA6_9FLAO|nr:conserved protein of unknown function [Flavobacterium collinsii]
MQNSAKILQQLYDIIKQPLQLIMRKALLILLSVFYLVLSSGFTTITHFCKGVQQETNLFGDIPVGKVCPKCVAKNQQKSKDCCKHKAQFHKVTEKVHQTAPSDLVPKFIGIALPIHFYDVVFGSYSPKVNKAEYSFSSFIPIRNNPLYIFYCVYRI